MKKTFLLMFSLLVCLSLMGQSDEERGHNPNSGIFLSMSLGPSYMSINDDIIGGSNDNITFKGVGIVIEGQLGIPIKRNFIAHVDFIRISSGSVDVRADGEKIMTLEDTNSISMTMFGAGITYYIMPQNIFISGSFGLGGFSLEIEDLESDIPKGFGLFCKIGKEWYVSNKWDLGFNINLDYTYVNNEVGTVTEKLSGFSVGVGFNATFN